MRDVRRLEVAAQIGKELEPAVREFTAAVTGSATHEVGEMLADKVRLRRYRSQLKILKQAQRATAATGLPPGVVPLKTLAPLLEFGSLEEEANGDMVARWANLLANAATAAVAAVPPSFADLLRQLEPLDAQMIDALYDGTEPWARANPSEQSAASWATHHFEAALGSRPGSVESFRLENLVRLGVCFFTAQPVNYAVDTRSERNRVLLTDLGVAFVVALRPPAAARALARNR